MMNIHFDGLEYLTTFELQNEDYRYYLLGLWRDAGGFYLATGSGCSCYTPWESTTRGDLTGPLTLDQLVDEATSLWSEAGRRVDLTPFLLTALKSFQATLGTRWIITERDQLDDIPGSLVILDADGVQWLLEEGCDNVVRIDPTTGELITQDEWDLKYPLEILNRKDIP